MYEVGFIIFALQWGRGRTSAEMAPVTTGICPMGSRFNGAADFHPRKQATSNSLCANAAQSDLREALIKADFERSSTLSFALLFLSKSLLCGNIERFR